MIIASDVAYDHRVVNALVTTLTAALESAKNAGREKPCVLFAYRCSDVLTADTLKAERKFFSILATSFIIETVTRQNCSSHVHLYKLERRESEKKVH